MPYPFKAKDKATGQLNAGINASILSIVLKSGEGANFPQPYTGTATSGGSSTTLNSTGIGASGVAVGDYIHNVTDDSWATITVVATHSVTTTKLKGGTDNSWDNSDTWRVNEFVVTIASVNSTTGNDTAYEEALVSNRSTDTLTVPTGGRGYNGTVAQAFNADDYVQLRVVAPYHEELKKMLHNVNSQTDTNTDNISTNTTDIANQKTGSYHYVVATGSSNAYVAATPALAAYAAGNIVRFKANHTNTGAATLNVNSLGAKTIKKNDGATDLSANDIVNGQIVEVEYDGTNFQMLSPTGTPATITHYHKVVHLSGTSSTQLTNPTSATNFDTHTYSVPATDIASGVGYEIEVGFSCNIAAGSLLIGIALGATQIVEINCSNNGATGFLRAFIAGTAAAGASVAVRGSGYGCLDNANGFGKYATANVATNGGLTLQITGKFSSSNGSNTVTLTMAKFTKVSSSAFA